MLDNRAALLFHAFCRSSTLLEQALRFAGLSVYLYDGTADSIDVGCLSRAGGSKSDEAVDNVSRRQVGVCRIADPPDARSRILMAQPQNVR